MMHENPMSVPSARISAYEGIPKAVLEADKLGLTLAQAFEPGRFSARQTQLDPRWFLLVRASDGWCWARIQRVDERGRLVLQREAAAFDEAAPAEAATTRRRAAA